jgi:hypothetical protein
MEVLGVDKLLALRNRIQFSQCNIRDVRLPEEGLAPPLIRYPGTRIPGFSAGTYLGDGRKEFWDTTFGENAVVIELENEEYTRIVVDVEHPEDVIDGLRPRF